jgi:hypothetical protein
MKSDSDGSLILSAHQQSVLTISIELEQAGFHEAARHLRAVHFPSVNWYEVFTKHIPWEEVFRRHNEHQEQQKRNTPF